MWRLLFGTMGVKSLVQGLDAAATAGFEPRTVWSEVRRVTDWPLRLIISGVRVQAGLYLDMLDADRSRNAVCVHAGTSRVDFEVDCPPPASCPPGDLLITMVKETVILYKKEFRNMKNVVSLIDLKVMKTWNDCEIACDCVKRTNVVLHVGLCKEIFARKHTATHKVTV